MKLICTQSCIAIGFHISFLCRFTLAFLPPAPPPLSTHGIVSASEKVDASLSFPSKYQTFDASLAHRTRITELQALRKKQTAIYDGAEFISIASVLAADAEEKAATGNNDDDDDDDDVYDDTFDKLPSRRAGYITFVTGTIKGKEKGHRVLGIQVDPDTVIDEDFLVEIDDDVYIKNDSLAIIPKGISDEDAIYTASASLAGIYCSLPVDDLVAPSHVDKKKAVVLGGGDYACFVAKALDSLGIDVTMVTTRPMSLKDTPLNPLYQSNVDAMPPAINDEQGFSEALERFDVVIDTLGDEANLESVNDFESGIENIFGTGESGVASKLKRENDCKRYISTVTQSQQIVLNEGILFARDPVLEYQKEIEKIDVIFEDETAESDDEESESPCMELPPPTNYGPIIQKLFDFKIIYSTDRNENGSHKKKKVFVKGCSFPDYAEREIWPSDSTDGASVRFGFPAINELAFEVKVEKLMGSTRTKPAKKKKKKKKKVQENPYVFEIESLHDITEEIVNAEKDAILFISAPYCKLCRTLSPQYTRMARMFKEEKGSDLLFAKASSAGKSGKQLTFTLNVDSVPTFILFKKGQKYGQPFGVVKVPSKKLEKAIGYLVSGEEWDGSITGMESTLRRTKIK